MTTFFKKPSFTSLLWLALALIVLARLVTLDAYPLFGTTEPRYAELARKMLATGDWVTLWVADGVPLWGKPPLLFWLDALSMMALGINEFALRLPPFVASLLTIWLFWFWPVRADKTQNALMASLIFFSTPVGFLSMGFVATDIFLAGGLALSMLSFWRVLLLSSSGKDHPARACIWHWLFFVGMAIGLLAKGPLSLVLMGTALLAWVLFEPRKRLIFIWRCFPWWRGLVLMALIAFPWYVMAEMRTPGFLHHFIIGEHFERFLVKDWNGGRFAPSHGEPLGMIWWFALESFVPWILLAPVALYHAYSIKRPRQESSDSSLPAPSETQYLLCWLLAPLVFFSLSHNILEAYVLPALPAFALLARNAIAALILRARAWQWSWLLVTIMPVFIVAVIVLSPEVFETQSQRRLLKHWTPHTPLLYVGAVPPSATFYSHNQAQSIADWAAIQHARSATVVMPQTVFDTLTVEQTSAWRFVESYSGYVMLRK